MVRIGACRVWGAYTARAGICPVRRALLWPLVSGPEAHLLFTGLMGDETSLQQGAEDRSRDHHLGQLLASARALLSMKCLPWLSLEARLLSCPGW